MLHINELVEGDQVRLIGFGHTKPLYRQRLLALGITRGLIIVIGKRAPLGCPVQIIVRGTTLTLRESEATHLVWERL